ncbi:MAG: hypothetical protein M3494_17285 [Actinomycetota bacterium]|jgi:hypothetical protein|nr:hypothetical protein [Rubrobacter sp.]MDQ3509734.1 hypothetical protein [Actinomycetota bacterium]
MKLSEENTKVRYAICVNNEGYEMDLVPLKVYAVLPPSPNESELNFLRIIDESGEDYLYSADYFIPVELSETDEEDVKRLLAQREAERS